MERHTLKDHGLTEKGNAIENSVGIAIFTTEALVKETVIERRPERLLHQCDMCHYNSVKKANLRRHKQVKHDGMTRPEMRGRKNKTGPLSDRTIRRRMAMLTFDTKNTDLTNRQKSGIFHLFSPITLKCNQWMRISRAGKT